MDTAQRITSLEARIPLEHYNYDHFRTWHLLEDRKRTLTNRGIMPGEIAPDFALLVADGGLADPTYLIDAHGRVAYYSMWTHAPNLNGAITALLAQGGRGTVSGGIDHVVHLLPAMTDGWRGIRRGLPRSYLDLKTALPGMGAGLWLGHQLRPLLAPVTLRAEPLPWAARVALGSSAASLGILALRALARGHQDDRPSRFTG